MEDDDRHKVLLIPSSLVKKSPFKHKQLYHEISSKAIVTYQKENNHKNENNSIKKYIIDNVIKQNNENNDEKNKKILLKNSNLLIKKINDIKIKLLKQANFNINKLKKYPITLPKISSFLNNKEGELISFYLLNQDVSNSLKIYLKVMSYQYIINPFIFKFNGRMKILNNSIIISKKKNILESKLNLSIRLTDILSLKSSKKYTILLSNIFSWLNNNNLVKNLYTFEYQNKRNNNVFWIYKECTSFNYNIVNKPMIMPIPPFNQNDIIKISINLISFMGFINFENFKWCDLKSKIKNEEFDIYNYYPIRRNKELNEYDLSKYCECEILKNSWKNYFQDKENLSENFVQNIKNIVELFSPFLIPLEIKWDNIGYYLARIKFKSVQCGELNNGNLKDFLNYTIKILPKEENLINEVRKNNLIYDNESNECLNIKQEDILIFYFTLSDISENISDDLDID